MEHRRWKDRLAARIPAGLGEEIDVFETQMELRKKGLLDEKVFAETRLRRGAYGQRYDNGLRHDGERTATLAFPQKELTKGPDTAWDAPGMMRIKIPMGRLTPAQLEVLAETAEEYSDRILHVTTRQDIQLHFIHLEDTPDLMRRLAAVDITTREACGNAVRNVTACQFAGVCKEQAFDVTPHADALTAFLLGHKDTQDFGRKFKIAFSGCAPTPCGLAKFHDVGVIAKTETVDGVPRRGFEYLVGGGLGAVPQQAKVLYPFVTEEELFPVTQAVCRVFAQLGERKNRAKARLKFVVQKLGIDEFRTRVEAERAVLKDDPRWTSYLEGAATYAPSGARPAAPSAAAGTDAFAGWRRSNCRPQAQAGYVVATVRLPLGDMTSRQARGLADIARRYGGEDSLRLTVEQNVAFRWLPEADLQAFHEEIVALQLGQSGAGEINDIVACPGTDTCKLGISSSRGLAAVLEKRLAQADLHPDVKKLHIKASGCFNSCSQHHVADIGFLGVSRNVGGRRVSHFQLVIGGEWANNGGAYGLAIGAFPSKRIPDIVSRVTEYWLKEREDGERLQPFIQRVGRAKLKKALEDLRHVPAYEEDKSFYTDWGDAREYTIGDIGVGECAGEVVDFATFGLADAERELFEASVSLDAGAVGRAAELAYKSMLSAAQALVRVENIDVGDDPNEIVKEFKSRLHDTKVFHDPFAGAKFAMYLLQTHSAPPQDADAEASRKLIDEAQLFVEAAHSCYDRMQEGAAS